MPTKQINFDTVRAIALALPGVTESSLHGAPSLKVSGRLLACPALHSSAEPDSLVVAMDLKQRDPMLLAAPGIYYVTEHYRKYPMMLVRLARIDRRALKELLAISYAFLTSKPAAKKNTTPRTKTL